MKKKLTPLIAVVLIISSYIIGNIEGVFNNSSDIKIVNDIPEQILNIQKEGLAPKKYVKAYVVKVVDGDTIEATYKGETQKVRLLYVDTPESVKPGVSPQEYSKEASEFTRELVLNKSVKLVFEKGLRDRYGRLLAHVILENGNYLNGMLVRNGLARVEVVSPNSALADYFYSLQEIAVDESVGIWGLPLDEQPFIKDEKDKYIPRYKLKQKAS